MPRLLLVDDNPSIHKIAETLLAASDVQLFSCSSGAQALALVEQGDRFDVALLDTSMMGMDGWTLLKRLRETEATMRMPVAMMAGVLDVVDPEKVRQAPIQGFLKKPIELRDLADRVRRLLETPVQVPPPAAPEPAPEAPADEQAAPAAAEEEAPAQPQAESAFLTRPSMRIRDHLVLPPAEDDLLLLGPEDVLAEEPQAAEVPVAPAQPAAPEPPRALEPEDFREIPPVLGETADQDQPSAAGAEPLELEELDLEGLRNLNLPTGPPPEPAPAAAEPEEAQAPGLGSLVDEWEIPAAGLESAPATAEAPAAPPEPGPVAQEEPGALLAVPEFLLADTLPDLEPGTLESPVTSEDLPDLSPELDRPLQPGPALADIPAARLRTEELLDWSDDSDSLVFTAPGSPGPSAPVLEPQPPAPAVTPRAVTPLTAFPDGITLSDILDSGPPPLAEPETAAPAFLPPAAPHAGPWVEFPASAPLMPGPAAAVTPAPAAVAAPAPEAITGSASAWGGDLLEALLADPVLMDRLAKALVARLGDRVLREIAWEIMPELAERLQRKDMP